MSLKIRLYGDAVLRKKCEPVKNFDAGLQKFIDNLVETLMDAGGAGLAAPQVGKSSAIIAVNPTLFDPDSKPFVLINPHIVDQSGEIIQEEGCLSFPGIYEEVKRPARVVIKSLTKDGKEVEMEGREILARVFAHEIDHLNGILFIDHISLVRRELLKGKLKELKKR